MPGDYLFPKKLFKDGEPFDTTEVNSALQTSAERLNGHLGPHNIRAPLPVGLSASANTFFKTVVAYMDIDSKLQHAGTSSDGQSPQPDAEGAFLLEQETGWQPVTGDTDMIVEMSTGSSSLSITAQATHCFAGDYTGSSSRFRVTVPLFDDPKLRSIGGRSSFAKLSVGVYLGTDTPGGLSFTKLRVRDGRNFATLAGQSREVADLIARGLTSASTAATATTEQDVQDKGWAAAVGYAVNAVGRDLIFTRLADGVYAPPIGDVKLVFNWARGTSTGNLNVNMTQVREGGLSSSPDESLSDLPSAVNNPSPGTTALNVLLYYPAQIQYALRVDGVVITETITGRFDNEQAPFAPSRIVDPRTASAPTSGSNGITGPMVGRFRERPDAINIPMFSVRLTASIDVEPGDHVVELVVRRTPTGRRRSFTPPPPNVGEPDADVTYLPPENRVYIYSRQLAVTDIPVEPVTSSLFGDPSVVASFSDEDVVSKQSLVDEKLQRVVNESNDIDSFQVARGAINGDHLEGFSSVIATASVNHMSPVSFDSTANNFVYPLTSTAQAFGSQRFFHELPSSWKSVVEAPLDVDATPPVECVFTIEGNVFLDRLVGNSLINTEMHLAAACFVIAVRSATTGTWYAWRPSIAWVNSNNYIAYQTNKTTLEWGTTSATEGLNYLSRYGATTSAGNPVTASDVPGDFVDVPVTAYIDFTGVVAGTVTRALLVSIDRVGIWCSAAYMGTANNNASGNILRSSLNAVVMKS